MFGYSYANILLRAEVPSVTCVLFNEVMKARFLQVKVLNPCDYAKAMLINFMGV